MITPKYFLYIPGSKSYHKDTLYSHYKFYNSKLQVDINKYKVPYDSLFVWMPHSSKKLTGIYKLLYAGLFTLN